MKFKTKVESRKMVCIYTLFFGFFMIILGACTNAPKILPPEVKWRITPYEGKGIQTFNPVFYGHQVLVSQLSSDSVLVFSMLSIEDGRVNWRCSDTAKVHTYFYTNLTTCQIGSTLYIPSGPILLALDMDQGKIIWKKNNALSGEDHLSTDGKSIFRSYMRRDFSGSFVYKINPKNGEHRLVDSVLFVGSNRGYARTPTHIGNKTLAFTYIIEEQSTKNCASILRFFDVENEKLIREDTIYPVNKLGLGVNKQPLYDPKKERLYLVAHDELVCYSTQNNQEIWRTKCPRDILSSDIALYKNHVYWPGEDGYLRQIDTDTGQLGWATHTSGTPSKLYIHGGRIYLIGGGNGMFQVIDPDSGEVLYTIPTPNKVNYPHLYFARSFAGDLAHKYALLHDGRDFFMYKVE